MRYRRVFCAGGSYFFTVNLADRSASTLVEHISILRAAIHAVRHTFPFTIDAMVVLPDHLHAIWTMPAGDSDYSQRWALVKSRFSHALPRIEPIGASRVAKRERGIWQRRFWEHQLRDENDFARHIDYIHINPVKHGHVTAPALWPYSSIHRYIRTGLLPENWAVNVDGTSGGSGE